MEPLTLAKDFMTTRLVTLRPDQHVLECLAQLIHYSISGAPVVDEDRRYRGVFSEKCCMGVLNAFARRASESRPDRAAVAQPLARDFMTKRLVTLTPDMDVFEAIGYLLKHRISGAPVIDADNRFVGSFSEKTSMRVLVNSVYEQLPTTRVAAFMNPDPKRLITEDLDVLAVADIFLNTHYRRLPVVRDGKLVGQVSRRDVLRAEHHLAHYVRDRGGAIRSWQEKNDPSCANPDGGGTCGDQTAAAFMDTSARTIAKDLDILRIAQLFLSTPYRRMPIVDEDSKLIGQISRRDVLNAANSLFPVAPPRRERTLLYLSSLVEMEDAPIE